MDEAPRQLGRYTLLSRFASGGMANLYLSRLVGPDGFVKIVALKVIHEHLTTDRAFVQMFVNEARLASRISHPNVAQIMELGVLGGTHYIAMEYVNGESVGALLRNTSPSMTYCARIVADAASGLHAAHQLRGSDGELLNVVHRDVSPQNILVSYDGAVKVVDFGVARARGNVHTTEAGRIKGKYAYMAPEQISNVASVDRRADVYALGIVLYEMTTGTRLFGGETEADVVAALLDGGVALPSSLQPSYPRSLERIVMRALEPDPQARYQTAMELQEALERFIIERGEPVTPAQVGQMMSRVFARQIEKKKALLARSEQGEVSADAPAPPLPSPSSYPTPARRSRPVLLVGGVAVAAVLAVLAVYVVRSGSGSGSSTATPDPAKPSSDAPAVAPAEPDATRIGAAAVPDAAPREITIAISATPRRARIRIDGENVGNPAQLRRPAGEGAAEAVISARGYRPRRITIPLARGGSWRVRLRRRGGRGTRQPGKKGIGDEDVSHNPYGR